MRPNMVLSVYVNRKQWKDNHMDKRKTYASFLHRIISGDDIEERNKHALWRDSLQPGGRFVDFYLPPKAVQRMRNNTRTLLTISFAEYLFCVISFLKTSSKDCLKRNNYASANYLYTYSILGKCVSA